MEKKKKYLVYYSRSPPDSRVMRLDKIYPSHRKYIKVEEWKGTQRQKTLTREVLSKVTTRKPKK